MGQFQETIFSNPPQKMTYFSDCNLNLVFKIIPFNFIFLLNYREAQECLIARLNNLRSNLPVKGGIEVD